MDIYKKMESQRKQIATLTKENDILKTRLAMQSDGYEELKELIDTTGRLKSEYEKNIFSLNQEREKYQKLSQDIIDLKKKYGDLLSDFTNELIGK